MKLNRGLHLAYCTNVHRGETWAETFAALEKYALAVREKICPRREFAIGLRLSQRAAVELSDAKTILAFQRWLEKNACYVFTINGFPFGNFHGARVKENVYAPDWTTPERLAYTNLLFDLLAEILPAGIAGSVSTVPCGFKGKRGWRLEDGEWTNSRRANSILHSPSSPDFAAGQNVSAKKMRQNLWRCVEHISRVSEKNKKNLHLGLEPEPLCLLENSAETISFFEQLRREFKNDSRLDEFLGVNYDTCHFAVEFEEAQNALAALQNAGIKISKLHLSSALKVSPTTEAREKLKNFADDVYLHQVIARNENNKSGKLKFFRDLPDALAGNSKLKIKNSKMSEWRIHFHVPLHAPTILPFENTNDHLLGALDWLAKNPKLCSHLEMETYTWEVLPPELKAQNVVDQLAAEYDWTLARLKERGIRPI